MTTKTATYTVSNTFEIFGDAAPESYDNHDDAQRAAREFAEQIASTFYTRQGDEAVIPFYDHSGKTGSAKEVDFQAELSRDAGATTVNDGRMPWEDLVSAILDAAIEIEEEEEPLQVTLYTETMREAEEYNVGGNETKEADLEAIDEKFDDYIAMVKAELEKNGCEVTLEDSKSSPGLVYETNDRDGRGTVDIWTEFSIPTFWDWYR